MDKEIKIVSLNKEKAEAYSKTSHINPTVKAYLEKHLKNSDDKTAFTIAVEIDDPFFPLCYEDFENPLIQFGKMLNDLQKYKLNNDGDFDKVKEVLKEYYIKIKELYED